MKRLVLLFVIVVMACKESEELPYSIPELVNCYNKNTWTQNSLRAALFGTWRWKFVTCGAGDCGKLRSSDLEQGLQLVLDAENKYFVYRYQSLVLEGEWDILVSAVHGFFEMNTTPSISFSTYVTTSGRLVLCENELLFNQSYVDGPDNLFIRNSVTLPWY